MVCRITVCWTLLSVVALGQLDYEREPISYSDTEATDSIAQLAKRLESGESQLQWEDGHGYLKAMLCELQIPISSQTLVFSKTSLQISRITPKTPRAVYFNDDVYIGWVQHGDVVEISAADPALGGTFYTLAQDASKEPRIQRETSRCLQCHGSTHTRRVPGHMVRSVYSDKSGQPVFRLGTHLNDHTTPFENRWGGWYVTGTHGKQRHMGNSYLPDPEESEKLDTGSGANITDLRPLIDTSPYLSPHSDIVALMVLQHQAHVHNVLTAANHSGRLTARDSVIMNKALERPLDYESESTVRRYQSAAEKVVKALLFVDEPALTDPVQGTSTFASDFESRGPFDLQQRTLRKFDLKSRLFAYPCSFLVHSDAFRALPDGVMKRVDLRLAEILSGADQSEDFLHLSDDDRRAIQEILLATTDLKLQSS